MDLIDKISKHLRATKRESEARVAEAHRDGNQVIYGGQARHDCDSKPDEDEPILLTDKVDSEHQENVDYYLAGQPTDDVITFGTPEVDAIRKQDAEECLPLLNSFLGRDEHLPVEEIERRAKTIVAARVINADYDNSFDINHCISIGCNKAGDSGCCMAYRDPTVLAWHRHEENCPTGPYQHKFVSAKAKKVNPLKASKRKSK